MGGRVASWLVRSTTKQAVRVRALAGDIVLSLWATHFTLTVPLSTQVYNWVPANCWGNLTNCRGVTCDGLASRPGEVEILQAASCCRNQYKLWQLWASLGSKASLLIYLEWIKCGPGQGPIGIRLQAKIQSVIRLHAKILDDKHWQHFYSSVLKSLLWLTKDLVSKWNP